MDTHFSANFRANTAQSELRRMGFVEAGQSRPSRSLLVRLSGVLTIAPETRDHLLTTAGYDAGAVCSATSGDGNCLPPDIEKLAPVPSRLNFLPAGLLPTYWVALTRLFIHRNFVLPSFGGAGCRCRAVFWLICKPFSRLIRLRLIRHVG